MSKFTPCPDFDLAPMSWVPRDFLAKVPPSERKIVGSFFALSVAFNDVKGLLWIVEQLVKGKSITPGINAYDGQWAGMYGQVKRLIIACFYEVMEAIKTNRSALDQPNFQQVIAKLGISAKAHWDILMALDAARKPMSSGIEARVIGFVKKVRNSIAFHYYEPNNFLEGYDQWIAASGPGTDRAYVSLGRNAEETRFFVADAVVEQFFNKALKDCGLTEDQVFDHVKSVNNSLRFVLEEFIKLYAAPKPVSA